MSALASSLTARAPAELGAADRDALRHIGDEVVYLHRVARLVNVLPLTFLLLWPALLPRLLTRGLRALRLSRRPALRALRTANVNQENLADGYRLQDVEDGDRRDLLALQRLSHTMGIALLGPPLIALVIGAGLRFFLGW